MKKRVLTERRILACAGRLREDERAPATEVRYITAEAARRGRADVSLKGKIRTILLTTGAEHARFLEKLRLVA